MVAALCITISLVFCGTQPGDSNKKDADSNDALQVEGNVRDALRGIEAGDVTLLYEDVLARRHQRIRIRFDKVSTRFDDLAHAAAGPPKDSGTNPNDEGSGPARLLRSRIETPNEIIIREKGHLPDGSTVATYVADPVHALSIRGNFDIRLLGSVPCPSGLLYRKQLSDYFGREDRATSEVSRDSVDGTECIKSSYRRRDDVALNFWVVPSQSWRVIRAEIDAPIGKERRLIQRTTSSLALYPCGVWFPRTVVFSEDNGSGFFVRERWEVEAAAFDTNPDADLFTIEGLELARGERLVGNRMQSKSGVKVWDGQNAVDLKDYKTSLPANEPAQRNNSRYVLFFVNIAVLLCAIVGYVVLMARKWFRGRHIIQDEPTTSHDRS